MTSVTHLPAKPHVGEVVTVLGTIRNEGRVPVCNFDVKVEVSVEGFFQGFYKLAALAVNQCLGPGQALTVSQRGIPTFPTSVHYRVTADPEAGIAECDETNNERTECRKTILSIPQLGWRRPRYVVRNLKPEPTRARVRVDAVPPGWEIILEPSPGLQLSPRGGGGGGGLTPPGGGHLCVHPDVPFLHSPAPATFEVAAADTFGERECTNVVEHTPESVIQDLEELREEVRPVSTPLEQAVVRIVEDFAEFVQAKARGDEAAAGQAAERVYMGVGGGMALAGSSGAPGADRWAAGFADVREMVEDALAASPATPSRIMEHVTRGIDQLRELFVQEELPPEILAELLQILEECEEFIDEALLANARGDLPTALSELDAAIGRFNDLLNFIIEVESQGAVEAATADRWKNFVSGLIMLTQDLKDLKQVLEEEIAGGDVIAVEVSIADPAGSLVLDLGGQLRLRATCFTAMGTQEDCTQTVAWSLSDPAVATVSVSGEITTLQPGSTTVVAMLGERTSNRLPIDVLPSLVSLAIAPAAATLRVGETLPLTATCGFSDGATQDCSGTVNWASSDLSVVSVSRSGLLAAVAPGTATVQAGFLGVQGNSVAVTVIAACATFTWPPFVRFAGRGEMLVDDFGDGTLEPTWTVSGSPSAAFEDQATGRAVLTGPAGSYADFATHETFSLPGQLSFQIDFMIPSAGLDTRFAYGVRLGINPRDPSAPRIEIPAYSSLGFPWAIYRIDQPPGTPIAEAAAVPFSLDVPNTLKVLCDSFASVCSLEINGIGVLSGVPVVLPDQLTISMGTSNFSTAYRVEFDDLVTNLQSVLLPYELSNSSAAYLGSEYDSVAGLWLIGGQSLFFVETEPLVLVTETPLSQDINLALATAGPTRVTLFTDLEEAAVRSLLTAFGASLDVWAAGVLLAPPISPGDFSFNSTVVPVGVTPACR